MPELSDLLAAARAARGNAYAPYSHFAVGAALLTGDGRRYSGSNVENASYGLTICAERTAIFRAVADGARSIAAIAVAGPDGVTTAPCGACRQVLAEFAGPDLPVAYVDGDGAIETTLGALLPAAFGAGTLDAARRSP